MRREFKANCLLTIHRGTLGNARSSPLVHHTKVRPLLAHYQLGLTTTNYSFSKFPPPWESVYWPRKYCHHESTWDTLG